MNSSFIKNKIIKLKFKLIKELSLSILRKIIYLRIQKIMIIQTTFIFFQEDSSLLFNNTKP
jgi:hypothetical protein